MKLEHSIDKRIMEAITKNPGLQHMSEDIFKLLDKKTLMNCRLTNSSWKNVLDQSNVWLEKLKLAGVPKDVQESWKNLAKTFAKQLDEEKIGKGFWLEKLKLARLPKDVQESSKNLAKTFAKTFAIQLDEEKIGKDWMEKFNWKNLPMRMQRQWKALEQELENDPMEKEFVLILIKVCDKEIKTQPLEVVVELERVNKYRDLVEFILENENPSSKVGPLYPQEGLYLGTSTHTTTKIFKVENISSIHLAAFFGLTKVVEKISKKYENPLVKETFRGRNPIHFAAMAGHSNIVKYLIQFTDTPLAPDNYGSTPIHMAVGKCLDTVKILVGLTDTPLAPDQNGHTPIHVASLEGSLETVKYLVGLTDTPLVPDQIGQSPIYLASYCGHLETVKYLVGLTDTPLAPDHRGWNPIHDATRMGHLEIVKYLVGLTDTPNAPTNNGLTPIQITRNSPNSRTQEVQKFLEEYCKK